MGRLAKNHKRFIRDLQIDRIDKTIKSNCEKNYYHLSGVLSIENCKFPYSVERWGVKFQLLITRDRGISMIYDHLNKILKKLKEQYGSPLTNKDLYQKIEGNA